MIRRERPEDYETLLDLYGRARAFMKETGNPTQWGDFHPTNEMILQDIREGGYVTEEDGVITGAFLMLPGPDDSYREIFEGAWQNDEPYYVIHRVCSDGKPHRKVVEQAVRFALHFTDNIRIDTHEDNRIMQHTLEKLGFRYCGVIYVYNGTARRAYQYVRTPGT